MQGQRLHLALEMCEKNEMKSQDELREMQELGELGEIFPNGLIRGFVKKALTRSPTERTTLEKENLKHTNKRDDKKAEPRSNDSKRPQQGTDLPPSKKYAAFISHKKVSSVHMFAFSFSITLIVVYHPVTH